MRLFARTFNFSAICPRQACPPPEPEFDYLCDDLSTPPLDGCCAGAGVVGGKRACPIGCGVYQYPSVTERFKVGGPDEWRPEFGAGYQCFCDKCRPPVGAPEKSRTPLGTTEGWELLFRRAQLSL